MEPAPHVLQPEPEDHNAKWSSANVEKSIVLIQAMERGRQSRWKLYERWSAATKIQDAARNFIESRAEQTDAATKVQAMQRGRTARVEAKHQAYAVTKVQAAQRGRTARVERRQQANAATKVQAAQRGRLGRHQAQQKANTSVSCGARLAHSLF